jgi:hypothetical protein
MSCYHHRAHDHACNGCLTEARATIAELRAHIASIPDPGIVPVYIQRIDAQNALIAELRAALEMAHRLLNPRRTTADGDLSIVAGRRQIGILLERTKP